MRRLAIMLIIVLGVVACAITLAYVHPRLVMPTGHTSGTGITPLVAALASGPASLLYNVSIITNSSIVRGLLFIESSGTDKYLLLLMYGTNAYAILAMKNGSAYTVCRLFITEQNNKTKVAKIISRQVLAYPIKTLLDLKLGNLTLYEMFTLQARYRASNVTTIYRGFRVLMHSVKYGNVIVPDRVVIENEDMVINLTLVKFSNMFNGVVMNSIESLCLGTSR